MKQFFTSILIIAVLAGCGTKSKSDKPVVTSSNSKQSVLPQPNSPVAGTLPSPNQVTTAPVTAAQTTTTSQAAGMNPEHGKPGHRCDIAVGAPLNSPSTATLPTTTTSPGRTTSVSQPVITTTGNNPPALNFNQPSTTSPTTKTVTAPGMNPPHGEAGHVCGIPVGSPLNGKTSTSTPTTNSVTAPTVNPTTTFPALKTDQAPATKVVTAPGMNPPHGEPGHVCGTPVGSPLNASKSAEVKKPIATPSITAESIKKNN